MGRYSSKSVFDRLARPLKLIIRAGSQSEVGRLSAGMFNLMQP